MVISQSSSATSVRYCDVGASASIDRKFASNVAGQAKSFAVIVRSRQKRIAPAQRAPVLRKRGLP
jgi:hypothetical protein